MWVTLAIQAATAIAKNYQERAEQNAADEALANRIIEAIKAELNTVKNDILHKLDDIQKEELQGLLRGYLNNFELYKVGMPDEVGWLQRLIADANYLTGKMYVVFRRYLLSRDYYNSRDLLAMYTPVITTYIYLLNEIKINFGFDNSTNILNTINGDILPGVDGFLELLAVFTNSRYSAVKETFYEEPKPDEKLSFITLSYDVLDGEGQGIEVNIMTYVKGKQKYREQIAKMRQDAIDAEILKLKNQIGLHNYVQEITKLTDEIILKITA